MLEKLIRQLRVSGHYTPLVERYATHLAACKELDVQPDPFEMHAFEVLNTPKSSRDWLLADEPVENYKPFVRFAQYETPRGEELVFGTNRRRR